MNKLFVLALALFALVGFTLLPGVGNAEQYRTRIVDLCKKIDNSFCESGNTSYLRKFRGGSMLANVGTIFHNGIQKLTYIELTIRFRGSVSNANHHVYLCDELPASQSAMAGENCQRLIDEYTLEEPGVFPYCHEWPNTFFAGRNGNSASYLVWDGPFLVVTDLKEETGADPVEPIRTIDYEILEIMGKMCPEDIRWHENPLGATHPSNEAFNTTRLWKYDADPMTDEDWQWRSGLLIFADADGDGAIDDPVLGATIPFGIDNEFVFTPPYFEAE